MSAIPTPADRLYAPLLGWSSEPAPVERAVLGLSWTLVEAGGGSGLAFSPSDVGRTLRWPGTLAGRPAGELVGWLGSECAAESALALATLNALVNRDSPVLRDAEVLADEAPPHLRVFAHFTSRVRRQRVAVIGHYPGLREMWREIPYQCLERRPRGPDDLPAEAAAEVLPAADWVFVTASSIANHSLPDLLRWSRGARVVLMGPSLPWLESWGEFGVEFLAGVRVRDAGALLRTVAEGGGTRIFATGVDYCLARVG